MGVKLGNIDIKQSFKTKGVPFKEKYYTGSYDREGLKQIGYSDKEIDFLNENAVNWDEEYNDFYKLTPAELAGDETKNTRFLPRNTSVRRFYDFRKLLFLPDIDFSKVTDFGIMHYTSSLIYAPKLDLSNATKLTNLCNNAYHVRKVDVISSDKLVDCGNTFTNCSNLEEVIISNTSKVTKMNSMFYDCPLLKKVPELDTHLVTNMASMFSGCTALINIPKLDTSNVTDTSSMFYGCKSLKNVPELDLSKVKSVQYMFRNCATLSRLPKLNLRNCTNFSYLFYDCYMLENCPEIDTSSATTMSYMFYFCRPVNIPELDASNVINVNGIFYESTQVVNFGGLKNLGQSYLTTVSANYSNYTLTLSASSQLTEQSIINVLTKLYDIASLGVQPQKVVLGTTNLRKLTSEEGQAALLSAQQKGWTVS